MAQTEHQDTFLSTAQFFELAARRCREAEQGLRHHLQEADEIHSQEMKSVADQEHKLVSILECYVQEGPDDVLSTRLQYQIDSKLETEISSQSMDEAFDNLLQLNKDLARTFHDQAIKSATGSVGDAMENIRTEVDAINRRISMIQVTAQDM